MIMRRVHSGYCTEGLAMPNGKPMLQFEESVRTISQIVFDWFPWRSESRMPVRIGASIVVGGPERERNARFAQFKRRWTTSRGCSICTFVCKRRRPRFAPRPLGCSVRRLIRVWPEHIRTANQYSVNAKNLDWATAKNSQSEQFGLWT
jgi:hypothetical protein